MPVTLTEVGDGHATFTVSERPFTIPVRLPAEEQELGKHLYQSVTLTVSAQVGASGGVLGAGDPRSLEEDLAQSRAEVANLRTLLAAIEQNTGTTGALFQLGPRFICITTPREDGEKKVAHAIQEWIVDQHVHSDVVADRIKAAEEMTEKAGAALALLSLAFWAGKEKEKKLAPWVIKAMSALLGDKELQERSDAAMRRYLDAYRGQLGVTEPDDVTTEEGGDGEAPATGGRIPAPETDPSTPR
jgi:hypothetical protein